MSDPTCKSIVVLYRGTSIATARVVAATSAPRVVAFVAKGILREATRLDADVALSELHSARRRALEHAAAEAGSVSHLEEPFSVEDEEVHHDL